MKTADRLSLVFGALAGPTRREILARLAQGEATVAELFRAYTEPGLLEQCSDRAA